MNFLRGLSVRPGLCLPACGIIAVSIAAPLRAQNTAGQIQLELSNTPLTTAISLLMKQSGAQIVVNDPTLLSAKKVTVSLSGITVDQALNSILTASSTPWYHGADGFYYINALAPIAPVTPEAPAPMRTTTTEKIELRHQSPSMMMRALGMDPTWPIEDTMAPGSPASWSTGPSGLSLRPAGAMSDSDVKSVDVNGQKWDVWSGNAYKANAALAAPSVSSSDSGDSAGRDIEETDAAGQIGFPRGGGGRRGGGNTNNGANGAPGAPATANGANGTQNQRLIPDGIDTVFPYQEDNSLLVRGDADAIDELKNIVALLDVPVRQVSIKAEFVTVSDTDADAFGLNFTMTTLNSNITSDLGGTGNGPSVTIGIAQGNVNATLTALKSRSRARTIEAPIISTLNNTPAIIQTSTSVPLFQPVISQGQGGNITTYQSTYITASTGLQVLPRVNRDGTVTVQISPQVSSFAGNVTGPNNQSLPTVVQQQLFTNRRVRSGESIVLGGLATKSSSVTSRGIPFLEDLPFVGRLFRSSDDSSSDSQLLIFLTPTIVEETSGAQVSPSS